MTFAFVLSLVMAVITEPIDQRMAPRAIALEIARVSRTPLEAAVRVEMAYEESRLIPDRVGDGGKSRCAFQLQRAPISVLTDLRQCAEIADVRLRQSARDCPDAPLSSYASGGCNAVKLSARRMSAASRLLARVE
jgi:hypothetical protein